MREWTLTAGDPMLPHIAADARAGHTDASDDQIWQLSLGAPDQPAVALETRYGGRVGLARIVPIWHIGRRQVYEAQGFSQPPVLVSFAPDLLRLRAALIPSVQVEIDFWTMESQAVGGRFVCHNTGTDAVTVQLDLLAQVATLNNTSVQMLLLSLANGQSALQLGRLNNLEPVLLLEGAAGTGTRPRLTRSLTLAPGKPVTVRWALGSRPTRDESLLLAHKWLAQASWDVHYAAIERRDRAQPQIATGHADWDAALAWSQQTVLRAFLGATGNLPHPSFVSTRRPADGYAPRGTHTAGFGTAWGGQSVPEALLIAPTVAFAAPEMAAGLVRNFVAVQRQDGWIDARPGLDGQRANVLAPPLLATLALTVYRYTHDRGLLADTFPALRAFFDRWFAPDMDRDGDGLPEWSQPAQGAFGDSPIFATNLRWAQGLDIRTVESPDLAAYLVREARSLIRIAELLDRQVDVAALQPRYDALAAHLAALWDPETRGFYYRDRDTHTVPAGDVLYEAKGDQPLQDYIALPQPSRLILRASGGLTRKPALSCTIEGVDANGQPAHEEIPAEHFTWYRNTGVATSTTVWRELRYLKFGGLSRVYSVQVNTVNLRREDQALLMPLWTDALDDDQAEALLARLTDPDAYWRPYGVAGCPATDPAYDPAHQNGCGGVWPFWNSLLAWALLDRGHRAEAAALFRRVLAAQIRSLTEQRTFRTFYNPDTGEGLGDSGTISGAVSLAWFARLFGAYVAAPGEVLITGPFAFEGEQMAWTQHGITITRSNEGTTLTFASGQAVRLPPDAEPGRIADPAGSPPAPATEGAPPEQAAPGPDTLEAIPVEDDDFAPLPPEDGLLPAVD